MDEIKQYLIDDIQNNISEMDDDSVSDNDNNIKYEISDNEEIRDRNPNMHKNNDNMHNNKYNKTENQQIIKMENSVSDHCDKLYSYDWNKHGTKWFNKDCDGNDIKNFDPSNNTKFEHWMQYSYKCLYLLNSRLIPGIVHEVNDNGIIVIIDLRNGNKLHINKKHIYTWNTDWIDYNITKYTKQIPQLNKNKQWAIAHDNTMEIEPDTPKHL